MRDMSARTLPSPGVQKNHFLASHNLEGVW